MNLIDQAKAQDVKNPGALLNKRPMIMPYPKGIEDDYALTIKKLIAAFVARYKEMAPRLAVVIEAKRAARPNVRTDSVEDDIAKLMENLQLSFNAATVPVATKVLGVASKISTSHSEAWQKVVKSVMTIKPIYDEPWLGDQISGFANQNTKLIQNLATDTFNDIEQIVKNGIQQGKRVEDINNEILGTKLQKGKFSSIQKRATLIARDQVGKLNGQLTELRQAQSGLKLYTWRTANSENVRSTHASLEGKICRWDDPTVYSEDGETWKSKSSTMVRLHPGQDYQCRCWAEAYFKELKNILK